MNNFLSHVFRCRWFYINRVSFLSDSSSHPIFHFTCLSSMPDSGCVFMSLVWCVSCDILNRKLKNSLRPSLFMHQLLMLFPVMLYEKLIKVYIEVASSWLSNLKIFVGLMKPLKTKYWQYCVSLIKKRFFPASACHCMKENTLYIYTIFSCVHYSTRILHTQLQLQCLYAPPNMQSSEWKKYAYIISQNEDIDPKISSSFPFLFFAFHC